MPTFLPEDLVPALAAFPEATRCWVALSGGLDSQVLLHALASVRHRFGFELRAAHIDHGLHPESPSWARLCREHCDALGVPLNVRRLSLARRAGESLEAAARDARYRALAELLGTGDLLLTAQHRDDQAETLLLALMRGSGVKGLAGMPAVARFGRARLVRPLLGYPRSALRDYARGQRLVWVEDPANADLSFDRVFLRTRVLPLLAERWPACAKSLAQTASHCAEAQTVIEVVAERELSQVLGSRPGTLSIRGLAAREPLMIRAVVRHWIAALGLPPPGSRQVERMRLEILGAAADRCPLVTWSGCEVRRYRDDLFAMPPLPAPPGVETTSWIRGPLELPVGLGRLVLIDEAGNAVDPVSVWPRGLGVRFAVGGLRCRPEGGTHRRRLKQLYQAAGVPPWLRPFLPCLFAGDQLVAVADLWRCAHQPSLAGTAARVRWEGGLRTHPAFSVPGADAGGAGDGVVARSSDPAAGPLGRIGSN